MGAAVAGQCIGHRVVALLDLDPEADQPFIEGLRRTARMQGWCELRQIQPGIGQFDAAVNTHEALQEGAIEVGLKRHQRRVRDEGQQVRAGLAGIGADSWIS